MIYFDNAATSGHKPKTVIKAVENALINLSANPGRGGYKRAIKAAEKVYNTRVKAAKFFNAGDSENVVFTLNCTHSINCVLKGVLKHGDHVVVSSLEHNAVMRPLTKMGISYSVAEVSFEDDEETVLQFKKKIKPNTRMVICTGASNVTGKILPIKKIGELCRKKGVLFAVDAAQIGGVLPVNMQTDFIDYLCIAPHKGLYSPMGLGMLICEKPLFNTIIEGGTGTESLSYLQPEALPERIESGTVNLPAIAGLWAGMDFVNKTGIEKIYKYEMELCKSLYNGLANTKGVILYTKMPTNNSFVPVISFNLKGKSSMQVAQDLADKNIAVRGGFHCAPSAHKSIGTLDAGTVRISLSAFNTQSEVNAFLNALNNVKFV